MEKQKFPKLIFSYLFSCQTVKSSNYYFEYLWKKQKIFPKSNTQPLKAEEEFTVLVSFEEGKCWQLSLLHSHRACVCQANPCTPPEWIPLIKSSWSWGQVWIWICGWEQHCCDNHSSDQRWKKIRLELSWRNVIEFLLEKSYWTDDLMWSGKA